MLFYFTPVPTAAACCKVDRNERNLFTVRPVKACGVMEVKSHSHLLLHFMEVNGQLDHSGRFNPLNT